MTEKAVEVKNLNKIFYKNEVLQDINLVINKGEKVGLIGSDGSGKSTLIRILAGLYLPTSGSVKVFGYDVVKDIRKIKELISYMPQRFSLYEELTVEENLELYSDINAVLPEDKEKTFDELYAFTGLKPFRDRLAGALSGGMKQKLGLACSIISKPKLLLLDEPSVGVDPFSRRELVKMVNALCDEGMSVLWSTSYLDEAQNFDNVFLLSDGRKIFDGKADDLTKTVEGHVFLSKDDGIVNRKLMRQILKYEKGITDAVLQGEYVRIVFDNDNPAGFKYPITPAQPRFEDAVIAILGGYKYKDFGLDGVEAPQGAEDIVIKAQGLTKKYGKFVAANNITFEVKKGEIFGLLGPNGAGKSTSFKMLCGLANPTSGRGEIMGIDITKNPSQARSKIGYMAQKFSLVGELNVAQNLNFFSGIYGLKGSVQKEKVEQMIDIFNFKKYLRTNAGELPLGYSQRLSLACAIMHSPPVLFLDEPTSGVDPVTRREFWTHINSMVENGTTVMVTTHFMEEAEYCDRISLIYQSNAIASGSPDELKREIKSPELPNPTMEDVFIRLIELERSVS